MSRVLKGVSIAVLGNIINAALNVLFIMILIRKQGLASYGDYGWYLALISSLLVLCRPNVWQALASKCSVLNEGPVLRYEISCYFCMDIAFSAICILICLVVFLFLSASLHAFLIVPYLLFYNNGFAVGYLRAANGFHYYALVQVLSGVVKIIGVMVYPEMEAFELLCVTLFVDGLVWMFLYLGVCFVAGLPKRKFRRTRVVKVFSGRLGFVLGTQLSAILDLPVAHFDRVVAGLFLSSEILGVYVLLRRIGTLFAVAVEPVSYVLLPEFSKALKGREVGILQSYALKMVYFITLFCGLSILVCFLGFDFFDQFLLEGKLDGYKNITILLILVQGFGLMFSWLHPFMVSAGMLRENNAIILCANLSYLILLAILSFFWSIWGAIFSLLLQYLIVVSFKYYYFYKFKAGVGCE